MTSPHPLDRPVWQALTTRQAELAEVSDTARRFPAGYGMFAAAADASPDSRVPLACLIPAGGQLWIVETAEIEAPPGTRVVQAVDVDQMVAMALTPAPHPVVDVVALGDDDAPAMRALAHLTEPGPFFEHTHRFGGFIGIRIDGQLAAMAGERMKPEGFTEVSGVCTHPDHRGHGYAGMLSRVVATRIIARGEVPFLHVYPGNAAAIALYAAMGFVRRRTMVLTVLEHAPGTAS